MSTMCCFPQKSNPASAKNQFGQKDPRGKFLALGFVYRCSVSSCHIQAKLSITKSQRISNYIRNRIKDSLKQIKILIKKDFTYLGQNDLIKNLSNDNYVYIVCQRVSSPWDRAQALTLLSGLIAYHRN